MLSLLTRVGRGCTMVITGDLAQSDINEANGLQDFIDKMVIAQRHDDCNLKSIVHVELTKDDVMRSDIVKEILNIYEL
jgi:phosphate starvation-inducible protein PhoH and related proteins